MVRHPPVLCRLFCRRRVTNGMSGHGSVSPMQRFVWSWGAKPTCWLSARTSQF